MATNWQAPFGMLFPPPFPPPQQQQQPPHNHQQQQQQQSHLHSDGQGAPSDLYQQPSAFFPPPPPPPPHIPGLNLQAHTQNAQQPQFPPAWPSTFPTPEQMTQWNQLQMDMHQLPFMMMQNPPPLPHLNFTPNLPSQSPFQPATPTHPFSSLPPNLPTAPYPQTASAAPRTPKRMSAQTERVVDVMDSDKEEGEVSEGQSKSPAVNGRGRPEPPRSIPSNALRAAQGSATARHEPYDPGQPAVHQTAPQATPTALAKGSVKTISQKRSDAKNFIKLLHKNNVGYHALAAEDLDQGPLRDLYQSLNLPSAPEQVPSVPKANTTSQPSLRNGVNGEASPSVPTPTSSKPITPVNTANLPTAKSVPSPILPNRAQYLKRLQAARKGKPIDGLKVTPPQKTPPPTTIPSKSPSVSQGFAHSKAAQPLTEAEKKAKTTELIRRRIEALKNSSSSPAASPAAMPSNLAPKPADASSSAFGNATPRNVPPSPFGNIPGLFMNPSPVALQNQIPITPGSGSRKRPSSPVLDSPGLQHDGNTAQDAVGSLPVQAAPAQSGSLRGSHTLPIIPGLQSRPASVNPSLSGISTPGPQTPSSTARSQELDEKARKQAALKERLQKKIELQKRESERRLASAQNSPSSLVQQAPVLPASSHVQEVSREPKRRRKVDVEAERVALDSEIAENAAKLAQMTKEMERLTANDSKLRRDKEKLQAELESMGIDTEGMPHSELQAKKDEIEREQDAATNTLPPPSSLATEPAPPSTQSATINGRSVPEEADPIMDGASQHISQRSNGYQSIPTGIPGLNTSYPRAYTTSQTPQLASTLHQPNATRANAGQSAKLAPAKPPTILSERDVNSTKPTTPVDDEEDFYSPEPIAVTSVHDQSEATSASLTQEKSVSEEGEMIMSESEEEDYEPEETLEPQMNIPLNKGSEQGSMAASSQASLAPSMPVSQSVDEEDEPYEPPDADQVMLDVASDAGAVEADPVQLAEAEEEDMDMSTSSDDETDSDTSSESLGEESEDPTPAPNSKNADSSVTIADDLPPELQPVVSAVELTPLDSGRPPMTPDVVSRSDKA